MQPLRTVSEIAIEPDKVITKTQKYQQLVQVFHADLYRFAFWLCGDRDTALDVVQETYLRAWKSLESLTDQAAAKYWLFTIARRENARRFSRKTVEFIDIDEHDICDEAISHEDQLQHRQLQHKLAEMPDEYREPLVMQTLFGFTSDEIAAQLLLNVNTVNTRLFRARAMLKQEFESKNSLTAS